MNNMLHSLHKRNSSSTWAIAVLVAMTFGLSPAATARVASGAMAPVDLETAPPPPPPLVTSFTVDGAGSAEVARESSVTFAWRAKNADTCTLGEMGPVSLEGTRAVDVNSSKKITLVCVQKMTGAEAQASVEVVVFDPPEIDLFKSSATKVNRGYFSLLTGYSRADVRLEWKVSGVDTCSLTAVGAFENNALQAAPKSAAGIVVVEPIEDSKIKLKCTGKHGAVERELSIAVRNGARLASWALFILLIALVVFAYRRRHIGLAVWVALCGGLFLLTSHAGFLIIGVILACLLLGQPLFVLMGLLTLACLVFVVDMRMGSNWGDHLDSIIAKTMELATKEVLLAIPFFVLAGEVMTRGTLAPRLIGVARAVFGRMPGGLAISGVFGCVFFAAISGSSPVTVIAIGSIMVPAMVKAGYHRRFSMGLISTAGSLGILIPPSIPMIIYAIVVGATTQMDPKELFLAGVMPGILIGLLLAGYSFFFGLKHKATIDRATKADKGAAVGSLWQELKLGVWSLLLPVIILGGIYSGVFTTTEAAAVSVVYAVVVEMFIEGELKARDLPKVAESAMTVMGALLLIIALAIALNDVLVRQRVPDAMVEWLQTLDLTPVTFLIMVNLFLLVVGCFMDIISAILIVAPMLAPMSVAMGIHPLHMGIIFIVNLEIGYLTPPLGLNLFVASTLFKQSLGEVIRAVIAPLLLLVVGLFAITWLPVLSTGLPNLLAGKPLFGEVEPTPISTPKTPDPKKAIDTTKSGGAKTLKEIMEEAKRRKESGTTGERKPKTLKELMEEAKRQKEGGAAPGVESSTGAASGTNDKPKTIQEIMQEAKRRKESAAEEVAQPPPPSRPKTIQEIMQEAKKRKAAEGTP